MARRPGRRRHEGIIGASSGETLREAGDALIAGMRAGSVRNRSGRAFKPSVIEGYAAALRDHAYPAMGAPPPPPEIRRQHVQALADYLAANGKRPRARSGTRSMPVRVVFRRAIRDGVVAANPTTGIDLPADDGHRDRFATPAEVAAVIPALRAARPRAVGTRHLRRPPPR